MHSNSGRLLILCSCLLFASFAMAKDAAPLFADHATLHVTIEAPLRVISDQRDSDEYHQGKLRYVESNGEMQELDVKMRARGRYRRIPDTCDFPPIRLNFAKKAVKKTLFARQDKLKLITHCRSRSDRHEQVILREYLTYRFWQEMTDYSFRVRLLKINWIDSERPDDATERYGFLLEDEMRLGKRIGMELSNVRKVAANSLLADHSALLGVYEYMIANTDFSMLMGPAEEFCCHNVVLYKAPEGHVPIPYDFDFAGLVNAPYATPNPKLRLRSVRTRLYRGRCEHNDRVDAAIEQFQSKREDLYKLVDSQPGMHPKYRKSVKKFLDAFYKTISNPKKVQSRLLKKCV
ncbi:MAG: hypothetical protein HKN35_14520 [Woeseia sp.]|nr:hypothetical protein [Woeseia sp.]MBT8096463.1 hypothetical protein [Woeseia sp.]NNE62106.1 hypothetical protein [Woeseia sp.]NNL55310.1 hypothetical protein [Woeseia sp.]